MHSSQWGNTRCSSKHNDVKSCGSHKSAQRLPLGFSIATYERSGITISRPGSGVFAIYRNRFSEGGVVRARSVKDEAKDPTVGKRGSKVIMEEII